MTYFTLPPAARAALDSEYRAAICAAADAIPHPRARRYRAAVSAVRA